ncbi:MAG: glucoamylase family protein [Spirosomataceae bacterium]
MTIQQNMFSRLNFFSQTLFAVCLSITFSCKPQNVTKEENFYYKSVTVNGQQSGGFYANGLNLRPVFEVSFSAPVNRAIAQKSISIIEKSELTEIPLTISFLKSDSSISITPAQNLKGITEYSLLVKPELESAKKTKLFTPIKLGITTGLDTTDKFPRISDDELLTLVQKQHFKYFWDFGHPVSGLARERNTSGDVCTSGGTGFGIMAMVVAADRGFVTRQQAAERLLKITTFLKEKAITHHGAFPHWLNGETGATVPFSTHDNGGDIVETSYLIQGLLTARQYFNQENPQEKELRQKINAIWEAVDWAWYTRGTNDKLYWHWSPNYEWKMNMPITGWNECLITYFLAASSPTHPISRSVYENCWTKSNHFNNGKTYFDIKLPLGFEYGGPLFFSHYSFLGLNPHGLKDKFGNYWQQNLAHTQINYRYCLANPKGYRGYSKNLWGLTASDSNNGYAAHSPTEDLGVISPTAAISAMPYMPKESMEALRYFYYKLGDKLWKEYGFIDAFNLTNVWFAESFLAIDQGPIICMIENHRTGLLWKNFMSAPEVAAGKTRLGFE